MDSGLGVLNTSLSGIFNRSPVMVGSILNSPPGYTCIVMYTSVLQRQPILPGEGGGGSVAFISEDFKVIFKMGVKS